MPRRKPAGAVMPSQPEPVLDWLGDYEQLHAGQSPVLETQFEVVPPPQFTRPIFRPAKPQTAAQAERARKLAQARTIRVKAKAEVKAERARQLQAERAARADAKAKARAERERQLQATRAAKAEAKAKARAERALQGQAKRKQIRTIVFPPLDTGLAERILNYLVTHYSGNSRPPRITARALAMLIQLHHKHIPAPTRTQFAQYLGCSVWAIDNIVAAAMARGLLTEKIEFVPSEEMVKRQGVQKEYFYVPDETFLAAVDKTIAKVA